MKRIPMVVLSLVLAFGVLLPMHSPTRAAETDDLYAAINAYRTGLGLTALPLSPQLTAVAQAHVQDLIANSATDPNYTGAGCIPHGWSSQGAWTGGCYRTEDPDTFSIMWNKPQEISNYPGSGFEILFGTNGMTATATAALQAWQADPPHNDVIVNQGIWQSHPWQAVGVWVQDGWASVWFGEVADPNATQPAAAPAAAAPDAADPQIGAAPAAPPADTGAGTTENAPGNATTDTATDAPANGNGTTDPAAANGTEGNAGAEGGNATGAATTGNANAPAPACGDAEELAFLALINAYRAANGVGPLAMSPTLTTAARGHSQDMAAKNYFDHNGLDGSTFSSRIAAAGYPGGTTAENIFAGDQTAKGAFESWRNSPGHNANMLNPAYTAIGIGRAFDANADFGWYWTTTFGDVTDAACGTTAAADQPAGDTATTGQAGQAQPATADQPAQGGTAGNTQDGQTANANDPVRADSDGDGLLDDTEFAMAGTDPTVFDTDGGGVGDGDEWVNGRNPLDPADDNAGAQAGGGTAADADDDGDGLLNDEEAFFGTNPNAADSDGDGVNDLDELFDGTDPLDPNSL